MNSVNILIADDHAMFRRSLRALIESRPEWRVCGEAADGKEAVEKAVSLDPDVILMDVSMPEMNGLDATKLIRHKAPRCKILVVSQNDPLLMQKAAVQAGALGFVHKATVSQDLIPAIEGVTDAAKERSAAHNDQSDKRLSVRGTELTTGETRECWVPDKGGDGSQPERADRPVVLLAEDNADMRDYVQRLLNENYDVIAAADGEAALQKARERRPDLILSDIMMPKLDGLGLLHAARSDSKLKDVPFILLSARAGEESQIEGLHSGADDYLIKPFSARELLARVSSHLEISRARGQSADLERKARLDAEMLAAIVASSDDAIISKNLQGIITSWNKGAERIFGYTAHEAVGQSIMLIIPDNRQAEEVDILRRLRRGERIDHFETIRVRKDGMPLNVSATISPLRDATGRVVGASKVARDITDQKRAEAALRENEERLRALVNASSYAVYRASADWSEIRDFDGRNSVSNAFHSTTEWLARVHPDDRAKMRRAISEAKRSKGPLEIEYRVVHSDGNTEWTLSRAVPLLNPDGEVTEWFGASTDVTARRQAEENYRKLAETLDVEVRARTKELEVRNAEVSSQADQLRDLSQRLLQMQDDERRHIARELHDSAGQTLTVLGMNLAKLAGDIDRLSPQLTQQVAETEELVQQLQKEIRTTSYLLHPPLLDENGLSSALNWYIEGLEERSGLQVRLDIPDDFGRVPREIELVIFRLVQEGLTNIHRHSGASTARIRVMREGERICVGVEDNGKGMPPDRLAEVQTGGGVGIRGIRERVRKFRGKMTIDSDASGTKIAVEIPTPESLQGKNNDKPQHAAV